MIVDARTYAIKPGQMPAFLKNVEEIGQPLQRKHGFEPAGYYTVGTGAINSVVHYWKWENAQVRQDCREVPLQRPGLDRIPQWQFGQDRLTAKPAAAGYRCGRTLCLHGQWQQTGFCG